METSLYNLFKPLIVNDIYSNLRVFKIYYDSNRTDSSTQNIIHLLYSLYKNNYGVGFKSIELGTSYLKTTKLFTLRIEAECRIYQVSESYEFCFMIYGDECIYNSNTYDSLDFILNLAQHLYQYDTKDILKKANDFKNELNFSDSIKPIKTHIIKRCYLMSDSSTKLTKIGFSSDPYRRERTLQSEKPTITMIHFFEENCEKKLHKLYADKRVRGEWFKLSKRDINNIIKTHI